MVPPVEPKSHCLSPVEIRSRLESAGIQPTAQRIAICRYVLCEADHPTAEEVKAWADQNFPKISLATVYNTLHTLVEAKLLKEFRFPHSEKVIYDNNLTAHYHFLDEQTGALLDIAPSEAGLPTDLKTALGAEFEISGMDILFRGRRT